MRTESSCHDTITLRARPAVALRSLPTARVHGVDKVLVLANGRVQAFGAKDNSRASNPAGGGINGSRFTHSCSASHSRGSATTTPPFDAGPKIASARDRADGIRECLIAGSVVVLLLVGGLGAWGMTWSLAGAVPLKARWWSTATSRRCSTRPAASSARSWSEMGRGSAEGDLFNSAGQDSHPRQSSGHHQAARWPGDPPGSAAERDTQKPSGTGKSGAAAG